MCPHGVNDHLFGLATISYAMHLRLPRHGPLQDGDVDSYLRRRNGQLIPEKDIMVMFVQICLGLHHVHTKVMHMSVTNVLCLSVSSS
jgi:hypothetical protein